MKKFADKLSLESTHFEDLFHVVEEAIQSAYDVISTGDAEATPSAPAGQHAIAVAKAFCKLQDEK